MLKGKYHFEVFWSEEDHHWVARCKEFPSMSFLEPAPIQALGSFIMMLEMVEKDMEKNGEILPQMVEP